MEHKIISVYGNSGSYKTSTALNLAKTISEIYPSAGVAIVGLDMTKPLIPILFPNEKEKKMGSRLSLGKLLSLEYLDQEATLSQMKTHNNIGVLGYNAGENYNSYAFPVDGRIDDFYTQIRHLINYTIVDCTSNVATDKLTMKALINADEVIQLISCDTGGLTFLYSQEPILLSEQYGYGNYRRYLTVQGRFFEDTETMKSVVTKVRGVIPFSTAVAEKINQGRAFEKTDDAKYIKVIKEIARDLTTEA